MMLTTIIPSYLYQQYADDENLQGFVAAYNNLAQQYLDWFNNLNLPNYTVQSGAALDWVAKGIYGLTRPTLPEGGYTFFGEYNTNVYNLQTYNKETVIGPSNFYLTTDDIFQRCITWNFYKGDGTQFNIKWLKNRVIRFVKDLNGLPLPIDNTYDVSVTFTGLHAVLIALKPGAYPDIGPILQSAINAGVLSLPFQYTFTVTY